MENIGSELAVKISNDELNFKYAVLWRWGFSSWFARWSVSHSTGNNTGFQMILLPQRMWTFWRQLPCGCNEIPEGGNYRDGALLSRPWALNESWVRALARKPGTQIPASSLQEEMLAAPRARLRCQTYSQRDLWDGVGLCRLFSRERTCHCPSLRFSWSLSSFLFPLRKHMYCIKWT
jgi:hypothetical protein